MKLIAAFLLLAACATKERVEDRHALADQILAPRIGYKTLTNQLINCDKKGVCTNDVKEYDLNDVEVRRTLKALGFRCLVNGHIYFICANGPGLCRRENDKLTKFLGIVTKREAVFAQAIDINANYQFLLDAKTRCKAHNVLKN